MKDPQMTQIHADFMEQNRDEFSPTKSMDFHHPSTGLFISLKKICAHLRNLRICGRRITCPALNNFVTAC